MDISQPFGLTDTQVELFTGIGDLFAVSEVDADQAVEDFARAVSVKIEVDGQIVDHTDYYIWTAGADVIKLAYANKKGLNTAMPRAELFATDTIKQMWTRFTKRVSDNYGLVKPASPSVEGQKKADQRSKAQLAMDELKAKPISELQNEIALLTAKATEQSLKDASKRVKAIKAKNEDALKDRMDGIKSLQKEVVTAAKNCMDESLLQDALHTLEQYQPEDAPI
jgi:hypothetical protein